GTPEHDASILLLATLTHPDLLRGGRHLPNLLFRAPYSRNARRKSTRRNDGQYASVNQISEYALCHNMKPDSRCSPEVRITRSGSGCPEVYRCSPIASTVIPSTSSAPVLPSASSRSTRSLAASAISCRPPYPIATLTLHPGRPALVRSAAWSRSAIQSGRISGRPTGRTSQLRSGPVISSTTSAITWSSSS